MRRGLGIIEEPRGETYLALLRFARKRCERFSLVWRTKLRFNSSAINIARALEPDLERSSTTNEWPGTRLIGHTAVVRHYRITRRSMEVLEAAPGLFSWLSPDLPEDLAFYSTADVLWLGTISHEEEAWFADPSLSQDAIIQHVPGIVLSQPD